MYTLARYARGPMERSELKRIMHSWPILMKQTSDPWAMGFAAEIWEKSADPMWLPTLKQAHFMRHLNREITKEDDNFDLIE